MSESLDVKQLSIIIKILENHPPTSDRVMTTSLPSYDLVRLFSHYRDSGGVNVGKMN